MSFMFEYLGHTEETYKQIRYDRYFFLSRDIRVLLELVKYQLEINGKWETGYEWKLGCGVDASTVGVVEIVLEEFELGSNVVEVVKVSSLDGLLYRLTRNGREYYFAITDFGELCDHRVDFSLCKSSAKPRVTLHAFFEPA